MLGVAIGFPGSGVMGDHRFMNIMRTPKVIKEPLEKAAGHGD